jgi:hypothetical protein
VPGFIDDPDVGNLARLHLGQVFQSGACRFQRLTEYPGWGHPGDHAPQLDALRGAGENASESKAMENCSRSAPLQAAAEGSW